MDISKEKDNLNLSDINVVAIPHDIIFPDELNQHLKGQLQFLLHHNGLLQKTISEKDTALHQTTSKISQLNTKISEYEQLIKPAELSGNPSHMMSAKIIELSKKLKDKTVENESLKTKFSKLQQKLTNLENFPPNSEPESSINNVLEDEKSSEKSDLNEEVKTLQEKLSQTNNKLFEMKNNNLQLKNELKAANKILQQEIGDSFTSIQHYSNSNTNWRGRAQQIISLQQKNSELQEKLTSLSEKDIGPAIPKVDPRKQIIEQLQKEMSGVKNELEDTRKKLNGSRARVKVLENECCSMKNKMSAMETKSKNDEKLIHLLTNQVTSIEESNNTIRKEKHAGVLKVEEENKKLEKELLKEKTVIENLKKVVDERDKKIQELQKEIQYHESSNANLPHRQPSPKDISKLNILEVEVNRLLELTTVLNSRLEEERNNHCVTQMNYKRERQRAAKLELKLSRIELENSMTKTHTYTGKSMTKLAGVNEENYVNINIENLKNNLELAEENISILKKKLNIIEKEKELDYQRFSSILSETSSMLLKYNTPQLQSN